MSDILTSGVYPKIYLNALGIDILTFYIKGMCPLLR